jgi:hypothetical protein
MFAALQAGSQSSGRVTLRYQVPAEQTSLWQTAQPCAGLRFFYQGRQPMTYKFQP